MEPAKDERALYAQLDKILIDKVTRNTVKYVVNNMEEAILL